MANPTIFLATLDDTLAFTDTSGAGTLTGVDPVRYDGGLWLEESATNLMTNPSFETARTIGDNAGAYVNGTATVQAETGDAQATGDDCVSISSSTAGAGGIVRIITTYVGELVISVDIWLESGDDDWQYRVRDNAFTALTGLVPFTVTSQRQRLVIPVTTSVNPVKLDIYLVRVGATASEARIDAVDLTEGTYATSHTDGAQGTGYAWTDTAHASTSTRAASSAFVDQDGTGRIDPVSGSIAFRYKRLIDTGAEEVILTCGTVGSGTDYLEIGVDASDKLYMEWNSNGGGAERVTSTAANIAVDTDYFFYFDWDGTTIRLSVDNGTLDSDTRDAVEGSWGAGDLALVAS